MLLQDFLGPEEAARLASESPDVEFEGMGDYEESIYADWRQPKGKGDAGESWQGGFMTVDLKMFFNFFDYSSKEV